MQDTKISQINDERMARGLEPVPTKQMSSRDTVYKFGENANNPNIRNVEVTAASYGGGTVEVERPGERCEWLDIYQKLSS